MLDAMRCSAGGRCTSEEERGPRVGRDWEAREVRAACADSKELENNSTALALSFRARPVSALQAPVVAA